MQASKFIATDPILTICITHKHYQPTEMTLGLILQYTSHSRHDAMTTTPSRAPEFPLKCTAIVCVCACLCICVSKHVRKIEMAWFEITTLLQFHHKNDTHTHTHTGSALCVIDIHSHINKHARIQRHSQETSAYLEKEKKKLFLFFHRITANISQRKEQKRSRIEEKILYNMKIV